MDLDDAVCFPMRESPVLALDFNERDRSKLSRFEINTIDELLTACLTENRFSGLKYIDHDLYQVAIACLKDYGYVLPL